MYALPVYFEHLTDIQKHMLQWVLHRANHSLHPPIIMICQWSRLSKIFFPWLLRQSLQQPPVCNRTQAVSCQVVTNSWSWLWIANYQVRIQQIKLLSEPQHGLSVYTFLLTKNNVLFLIWSCWFDTDVFTDLSSMSSLPLQVTNGPLLS